MLKHLSLQNFRNHTDFQLDLGQITVIVGKNGAGKSNILEALSMLSVCRSFREAKKQDMIADKSDFARILADDIELFFGRVPKFTLRAKIKGVSRRLTSFVGFLPSVSLSPETMSIVTGGPKERRRFLDVMMSQVDHDYLESLVGFEKVKKQRNQLLKQIKHRRADESELKFWDDQMVRFAEVLTTKREETIRFLEQSLSLLYQQISLQPSAYIAIEYVKNYSALSEDLLRNRSRDISDERTNHGPHRDDLNFTLNGFNMANYASRGEIKSMILALKIGELKYIENERKKNPTLYENVSPVLLLDDIFSEFDPARREELSKLIGDYQTVITTTDRSDISEELLAKAVVVELSV